ncbi:hypothetical protein V1227_19065 [Lentzea sp. DG1S-22]|uniref:hypothetical protein n=1 Tax=Lentzea sp. DG1S-22 TaxID=3108822 RepID=UPI002E77AB6F|nr:hypothetical protein [Lentzea sp. DG1S-22]WVH84749.1 hypothetical protein V1227_19065 [Lentzea sp. DG1S-22]
MSTETITVRVPVYPAEPRDLGFHPEHDGLVDRFCVLCRKVTRSDGTSDWTGAECDQVVLSDFWGPVHATCYVRAVEGQHGVGAWVVLASDIAKRPSRYSASDIRSVLRQLLRIVSSSAHRKAVQPE